MREDFATDPAARGWRTFGDASLFHWDPANQNLAVTWDSSRTNSYFYLPLGTVLCRNDNFEIRFSLRLDGVLAGVNPEKPSTFEIAAGLIRLASATNVAFNRGTGRHSPNLIEFDYFPEADIIAPTVSPAVVSSNSQFATSFAFPLEMPVGDLFRVTMRYTASNGVLATAMTRNGAPFGPIPDVVLPANPTNFSDFRVDAFSISSYDDRGDFFGSILASGVVDDIEVDLPEPPVGAVTGRLVGSTWRVQFLGRTNWFYALERTTDLRGWTPAGTPVSGVAGTNELVDVLPTAGPHAFYRVRADRL